MRIPTAWLTRLLRRKPAGHLLTVRDDDTFIVSYPKSGNTWVRFLVANLVYGNGVDFARIEKLVPDIYQNTSRELDGVASPRYLKSHESYDPRYERAIYITRDPRDVVVSYYYHRIKIRVIPAGADKSAFVDKFVSGRLDRFGSWGDNVGSWLAARSGDPDFLVLHYEDVLADTAAELQRIAKFLKLDRTDTQIESAIAESSFERMRAHETAQGHRWRTTERSRKDMYFVRSAGSGGWEKELSDEMAQRIVRAWPQQMATLGYIDR